jgi:hypothetical protein
MTLVQARLDQASTHSFLQLVVAIHASTGDVVLRAVHSKPPALRERRAGGPVWQICRHGVIGSPPIGQWLWRGTSMPHGDTRAFAGSPRP